MIRINEQWRVCFRWQEGDAYDVEIVDCHSEERANAAAVATSVPLEL